MADIKSQEARSKNMAAVKSKNTKPEVYFRKQLYSAGLRYRICSNNILGHPDIWLKKFNTAIFVHGCFWHRHKNCKYAYLPKSRTEFWNNKFESNIERDANVCSGLHSQGIKNLIVWECTIKKMQKDPAYCHDVINLVLSFLNNQDLRIEI